MIFDYNSVQLFIPASNAKLFAAALALDRLGSEFRIRTAVYSTGAPGARGRLEGNLILYGHGDPSLTSTGENAGLKQLAQKVRQAGVTEVGGMLVVDDSYLAGPGAGTGWEWDDQLWHYAARASALSVDENSVSIEVSPGASAGKPPVLSCGVYPSPIRVENRATTVAGLGRTLRFEVPSGGGVVLVGTLGLGEQPVRERLAIPDPAAWCAQRFDAALRDNGVRVSGGIRRVDWLGRLADPLSIGKLNLVAEVQSPPVRDLVREALKRSQNLYAQLLFLQVGAQPAGAMARAEEADPLPPRTETRSQGAMGEFLGRAGIQESEVILTDGAGLSRRDLVTPHAMVELLRFMEGHRASADFKEALPVAGVDGSLRSRMVGTPAQGRVWAKTGGMTGVYSLSGYAKTAAGERLAFALFLNNYVAGPTEAAPWAELDRVAAWLAGISEKTR